VITCCPAASWRQMVVVGRWYRAAAAGVPGRRPNRRSRIRFQQVRAVCRACSITTHFRGRSTAGEAVPGDFAGAAIMRVRALAPEAGAGPYLVAAPGIAGRFGTATTYRPPVAGVHRGSGRTQAKRDKHEHHHSADRRRAEGIERRSRISARRTVEVERQGQGRRARAVSGVRRRRDRQAKRGLNSAFTVRKVSAWRRRRGACSRTYSSQVAEILVKRRGDVARGQALLPARSRPARPRASRKKRGLSCRRNDSAAVAQYRHRSRIVRDAGFYCAAPPRHSRKPLK